MQLDDRSLSLLKEIIFQPHCTMKQLEQRLLLSRRQINYDLEKINAWLASQHLEPVKYQRQAGFTCPPGIREKLTHLPLAESKHQYVWSAEERVRLILLSLLGVTEYWSLVHACSLLQVSRNTALADLKEANALAGEVGVQLKYSRDNGYHLVGKERNLRSLLHRLVFTALEQENGEMVLREAIKQMQTISFDSLYRRLETVERQLGVRYTDERLVQLTYECLLIRQRIKQAKWIGIKEKDLQEIIHTPEYEASGTLLDDLVEDLAPEHRCREQAYLALLLLATNVSTPEKGKVMREVALSMVDRFENVACVNLAEKELLTDLLAMHLTPAYYRIKYGLELKNPLASSILLEHPELHHLVKKCVSPFARRVGVDIPEEETAYLTIHFGACLRRQGVELAQRPKAVVVCPKGIAVSHLLIRTLRELFPDILFLDALTVREFSSYPMDHELVFSTVFLRTDRKLFVVKPILSHEEKERLRYDVSKELYGIADHAANVPFLLHVIEQYADVHDRKGLTQALSGLLKSLQSPLPVRKEDEKPVLNELITRDTVQLRKKARNWEEAIRLAAKPLVDNGSVEPGYAEAMIASIHELGPYVVIAPKVAIPHARPEQGVNQLSMSFMQLNEEVSFPQNKPVRLLFVLAASDNESHLRALAQLSELLAQPEEIQSLIDAETKENVLDLMDKYSKGEMEA
ncbi:BglG family transcription antiterminator [Laceyella sacchari]|uniref:Ascorbate-specific PTS system EIIA component n=1 Tax=Laceyella sacchari TaxID=37482 RepID=A0ABY5TYY9_LACSH|nr:BglG family transcription antiterminator [Laceyella sacchari]UWE02609.1 BglG family transcription antiterminator [Laceyella sacchari]